MHLIERLTPALERHTKCVDAFPVYLQVVTALRIPVVFLERVLYTFTGCIIRHPLYEAVVHLCRSFVSISRLS